MKCLCGHSHNDPNVGQGKERRLIRYRGRILAVSDRCPECKLPPCIHFVADTRARKRRR